LHCFILLTVAKFKRSTACAVKRVRNTPDITASLGGSNKLSFQHVSVLKNLSGTNYSPFCLERHGLCLVPPHYPSRVGKRARQDQRQRAGRAKAKDAMARWDHASCDVAVGVYATACGFVAKTTASLDPISWGISTECEVALEGSTASARQR
jgi:hypothetical protein